MKNACSPKDLITNGSGFLRAKSHHPRMKHNTASGAFHINRFFRLSLFPKIGDDRIRFRRLHPTRLEVRKKLFKSHNTAIQFG
jgi:hypothetical protein